VHVGDHVLAVDDQRRVTRQPQRGVQDGTIPVMLMCSPANMPVIFSLSFARFASANRAFSTSSVTRFLL
jgi:hypothetical protein